MKKKPLIPCMYHTFKLTCMFGWSPVRGSFYLYVFLWYYRKCNFEPDSPLLGGSSVPDIMIHCKYVPDS